jgi:hypothetical protein
MEKMMGLDVDHYIVYRKGELAIYEKAGGNSEVDKRICSIPNVNLLLEFLKSF